jgi:dTDP-4-dehydrorhamnose 3,5-epimerase
VGLQIESRHFKDVAVVVPEVFEDSRGYFMEAFREDQLIEMGIGSRFVQDNQSRSNRNVLRGLHFQWEPPMGKLMRVIHGSAFLVAVDIRKGSPTLGQWYGVEASAANRKQVWAPAGFARGFCVLTDACEILYKCTGTYNNKGEAGIRWNDPEIGIEWPIQAPLLSPKDANAPSLAEWLASPESNHFQFS